MKALIKILLISPLIMASCTRPNISLLTQDKEYVAWDAVKFNYGYIFHSNGVAQLYKYDSSGTRIYLSYNTDVIGGDSLLWRIVERTNVGFYTLRNSELYSNKVRRIDSTELLMVEKDGEKVEKRIFRKSSNQSDLPFYPEYWGLMEMESDSIIGE